MNNNKITGLANGTANNDAINLKQLNDRITYNDEYLATGLTSNISLQYVILSASHNSQNAYFVGDRSGSSAWSPPVGITTDMWIQYDFLNRPARINNYSN